MKKRIVSLLLALALALAAMPLHAPAARAAETQEQTAPTAEISLSVQAAGVFLCAPQQSLSVSADLSDSYGMTDSVSGVSVLDALIAAHELVYGSAFTPETCGDYLVVSGGWVSNAFGLGGDLSFAVNGAAPNDGVYNELYGGYTGYTVAQAQVHSGDRVEFMFYRDAYYLDNYAWFECGGARVSSLGAAAGDPLSLTLKGYCYAYYGCSKPETIAQVTAPIEGAQLAWVDAATGALSGIAGAVTDESGAVGLAAPQQAGAYLLTAYIPDADIEDGATPCFLPLLELTVEADTHPYFESLEFLTSAFTSGAWVTGETYQPKVYTYTLPIKSYSTSRLTLQKTTVYDTERYVAAASYRDADGVQQTVGINSGAITYLDKIPFDDSTLIITISDRADAENCTRYTFHVTRPRDTNAAIKSSSGIALNPSGRALLATKYLGYAEGTMLKADSSGALTSGTGVAATQYYYRTYLFGSADAFSLTLTSSTAYAHLCYSVDGETWTQTAQGGGTTQTFRIPSGGVCEVRIRVLDDATYAANVAAGLDGFASGTPTEYTVWVERVDADASAAQITAAQTAQGDWYPSFAPDRYSYTVVVANGVKEGTLVYTAPEGVTVTLGGTEQTRGEDGSYTLALKTAAQTLTVTSADGSVSNAYSFKLLARSAYDVPDRVVDYLCINSQYTNAGYGVSPEATLAGQLKSLGSFGGYITYYYENPIRDDPANPYGVDFFVYGNANKNASGSFLEPGQVWVSEDGEQWYALAGSDHYEADTLWDYTVTYSAAGRKTAWSDNCGNSRDGSAGTGAWVNPANYPLCAYTGDTITLSGILLPAEDGSITGSGTSAACHVRWGYADCFPNGTIGEAVNPYLDNSDFSLSANGFDLAWAVDAAGTPVRLEAVHYVKVVTASNIWHNAFYDKSTEVSYVVRAAAAQTSVGTTAAPAGVTVSDGAQTKYLAFTGDRQVYDLDVGDMKYVALTLEGASADNVYINNTRGTTRSGIKVTSAAPTLVRVLVQSGEAEPRIYLIRLTGSAPDGDALISGVKLTVDGAVRAAQTGDGAAYTATVGSGVEAVGIVPVVDAQTAYTVNGEAPAGSYALAAGENSFTICAVRGESTQEVTLTVTRAQAAQPSDETITVSFTLYGDEKHADDVCHLFSDGAEDLPLWLPAANYTVPANATVLDVFTLALGNRHTWTNADGNYISEIDGLAEFDNGPNSGWLYQINGVYPSLGIAEQTLADGDAIVFHYTDDFGAENAAWESAQRQIAAVEALIDAIGAVTADSGDAIASARAAYDALRADQKPLVSNYAVLTAAEAAYAQQIADANDRALAAQVEALIDAIGAVTADSGDAIASARAAYDALTPTQKALVSNYAVLENAQRAFAKRGIKDLYEANKAYIARTTPNPTVASVGGEWAVLGLARSDAAVPTGYYDAYLEAVRAYVAASCNDAQQLHRSKSTENSRVILALSAIGADPADIGGHNLLAGLADFDYVCRQGVNGPIWALIALDCRDYAIPAAADAANQTTREKLIAFLLQSRTADGGWALSGEAADPDVTAMALVALAPYRDGEQVRGAIEQALACLSAMQLADGSFASNGSANAESCAQVVIALSTLGIDADTDERFVKSGGSAFDALLAFAAADGGLRHIDGGALDGMASEQGLCALAAYDRFLGAADTLYDMRGVPTRTAQPGAPATGDAGLVLPACLLAASCAALWALRKKRKYA